MRVGDALEQRPALADNGSVAAELPALHPDDDLRTALARLLSSGADALPVFEGDREIGQIMLADLRAMLHGPAVAEPAALLEREG
jgi:predicted transcriptional regulator